MINKDEEKDEENEVEAGLDSFAGSQEDELEDKDELDVNDDLKEEDEEQGR